MKKYNIKPEKMEFKWGTMDVVSVGEHGRGLRQVLVPYQGDLDAEHVEIGITRTGAPKLVGSSTPSKGWVAHLSAKGVYTRGYSGEVLVVTEHVAHVKVLAHGIGDNYDDYLVGIYSDEVVAFRIVPDGGAGKLPRYWLVFNVPGVDEPVRVKNEEVDLFSEATGIILPEPHVDYLTDLNNIGKES